MWLCPKELSVAGQLLNEVVDRLRHRTGALILSGLDLGFPMHPGRASATRPSFSIT